MILITVKREGFLADRELTVRAWRRVKRAVMLAVGKRWHQKYLRHHFGGRETVMTRYRDDYVDRSEGYKKRKLKSRGHRTFLVWSGNLKRGALHNATFKPYPSRCTVDLQYPTHIKRTRTRKWGKQQLDRELSAMADTEIAELHAYAEERARHYIAREKQGKVTKYGQQR